MHQSNAEYMRKHAVTECGIACRQKRRRARLEISSRKELASALTGELATAG